MTHHCHRSNWTGPESELRRGICPKCAVTTLYEDCEAQPIRGELLQPGWLREGLREVAENTTDEERRRVAEHPSGFMPRSHDDTRSIVVQTHRTRCGVMRKQPCTCTPTRERFYRDGRIVKETNG